MVAGEEAAMVESVNVEMLVTTKAYFPERRTFSLSWNVRIPVLSATVQRRILKNINLPDDVDLKQASGLVLLPLANTTAS